MPSQRSQLSGVGRAWVLEPDRSGSGSGFSPSPALYRWSGHLLLLTLIFLIYKKMMLITHCWWWGGSKMLYEKCLACSSNPINAPHIFQALLLDPGRPFLGGSISHFFFLTLSLLKIPIRASRPCRSSFFRSQEKNTEINEFSVRCDWMIIFSLAQR